MNTFVWKGKCPDGDLRSARVTAANAQEARASLEQQGWSELHLIMDEVCETARQGATRIESIGDEEVVVTVDDEVRFFEGKGPSFLSQYWKTLSESKGTILFSLALLAYGIYRGRTFPIVIGGTGAVFMLLLFPVLHAFFSLPGQYYARLNKAKVWGRWEEVLHCITRIRQVSRFTKIGPGDGELIRCHAQSLAALGRLDEGLKAFAVLENNPKLPEWLYHSQRASIFDCAKEYQKSLECRRKALEFKQDNSSLWIDLAYGSVRGLNYPAEAWEAVKRAEQLEIPALGKPYLLFLKGLIYWREAKYAESKPLLEQAIAGFQTYEHAPLVEGLILLSKSYLCADCGCLGELEMARKYLRETEKFLKANREDELLQACRRPLAPTA